MAYSRTYLIMMYMVACVLAFYVSSPQLLTKYMSRFVDSSLYRTAITVTIKLGYLDFKTFD